MSDIDTIMKENKELKKDVFQLKIGLIVLTLIAIFNVYFFQMVGFKKGYEEAVLDFYKGDLHFSKRK